MKRGRCLRCPVCGYWFSGAVAATEIARDLVEEAFL